jgi:hypothetical protein
VTVRRAGWRARCAPAYLRRQRRSCGAAAAAASRVPSRRYLRLSRSTCSRPPL